MQAFPSLRVPDGSNGTVSIMREQHAEEGETDGGEERKERKKLKKKEDTKREQREKKGRTKRGGKESKK